MKKTPSKKLSLNVQTIRNLTSNDLANVAGGSLGGGTSVISVSSGTSVISSGTSVISHLPSGGLPSGGSGGRH